KLCGFRVYADRPTGTKEVRAEPWASQCAAKNVYLVEDGTWDVAGWINEHCLFPLGKFKDRVDSASGAFGKLVNRRSGATLRVYGVGRQRHQRRGLRIVLGTPDELAGVVLEERHLVIAVTDPPPVGKAEPPAQGAKQRLGWLALAFADLDPADLQATWNEPIAPYGRLAAEVIMTRELGKRLWSFLLRRLEAGPEIIVLQDDRERRALSLAYAIVDVL